MQSGNFLWQVVAINLALSHTASLTPVFYNRASTMPSIANTLLLDSSSSRLFVAGTLRMPGDTSFYATISKIRVNDGSVDYHFGFQQPQSSLYLQFTKLAYIASGSNEYLFSCLEQNQVTTSQTKARLRITLFDFSNPSRPMVR